MPELPEVEITRRGLHQSITGQNIIACHIYQAQLRWPIDAQIPQFLKNTVVHNTGRRGKYLFLEMTSAAPHPITKGWLLFHLGMSGRLRVAIKASHPARLTHDHFIIEFAKHTLFFHDPRRFGAVLWHPQDAGPIAVHPLFANLGVEPLSEDFSEAKGTHCLFAGSRKRRRSIKELLLSGRVVAGLGNIYAAEALFHAKIHPAAVSDSLTFQDCERLAQSIRHTLSLALQQGGSSLRDFAASDGQKGYFQLQCMVYGRAHQACRICHTKIAQIPIQARMSFFCPSCQKIPDGIF